MNYLAEIKAFYDRLELNPQPNTVIALWHALMSIANKAGWPDTFTVASSVLGLRSGLNASALKRARNKLATDGLIEWKPRGGNQSAQYHIKSLVVQNRCENDPQCEPQFAPIIKHKHKLKQNNIPPISPIRQFDDFEKAYPKKIANRQSAEFEYCKVLRDDGSLEESALVMAAKHYAEAVAVLGTEERFVKNADNFIRDGTFNQYLDGNYQKPSRSKKGNFNNFEQNNYDFTALENELLSN